MKRFIYAAIIFASAFFITQCSQPRSAVFNREALQFQKFEIDISKDTFIKTGNGIVVQIKAGSLSSSNGSKVVLQIKEALQLADMIKAGLTTTANGELLSSGGMFFIEPEDKSVQIVSPLSVYVPTDYVDRNMNTYMGTETDGKINWENPEPVQVPEQENKITKGEELFKLNCTQCHTIGQGNLIGPDLVHITKRRDYRWLELFTLNSQEYLHGLDVDRTVHKDSFDASGRFVLRSVCTYASDSAASPLPDFYRYYSHCLFNQYNKTVMPAFKFTPEEMHLLYDYIEDESNRLRLTKFDDKLFYCVDSCLKYYERKLALLTKRDALIADNSKQLKYQNTPAETTASNNNVAPATGAMPVEIPAKYYQVNIKTFGWYNIDILLKDVNGVKDSKLIVRIRGTYTENISLFMVIPSRKVYVEGGKRPNSNDEYIFKNKEFIPLPQSQSVYVFAVGEANDKFIFGNAQFIAAAEQTIIIEPKEVSKEVFDDAIKKMGASDMQVSLDKTKNADEIREVEKSLKGVENLKPKNCDCNCMGSREATFDDILRDTVKTP